MPLVIEKLYEINTIFEMGKIYFISSLQDIYLNIRNEVGKALKSD